MRVCFFAERFYESEEVEVRKKRTAKDEAFLFAGTDEYLVEEKKKKFRLTLHLWVLGNIEFCVLSHALFVF